MSKKYLTHVNLNKNELQNAVIQPLATAPSSPVEGQIYYDTADDTVYVWANGAWLDLGASGGAGGANLTYSRTATTVTVESDTGTDATLPAADTDNAGVMTDAMFDKLAGIEAAADVTDADNVGSSIHGASAKTTPVDADTMPLIDSAASNVLKKVTWANIKATLKTYIDSMSSSFTNKTFDANGTGNSLSNVEVADFAGSAIITAAEGVGSNNNDTSLPTTAAVKAYADAVVGAADAMRYLGAIDASSNPNYPTAVVGDTYKISVAGKIGGASGLVVEVGDTIIATADNGGGNQATVGASWNVLQTNTVAASETVAGTVELATVAEAQAKTDTARAVTPAGLTDFTRKFTATIGDNSATQIDVTHNFGTKEVMTQVRQASDDAVVECDVTNFSTNVVRLNFAVAPASSALKVVVIG